MPEKFQNSNYYLSIPAHALKNPIESSRAKRFPLNCIKIRSPISLK